MDVLAQEQAYRHLEIGVPVTVGAVPFVDLLPGQCKLLAPALLETGLHIPVIVGPVVEPGDLLYHLPLALC